MDIATILKNVALFAGKEIVKGVKALKASKADNVAVRPVAGGELVTAKGHEVIAALKAEFPGIAFTWMSKPHGEKPKDPPESQNEEKDEKGKE